MSGKKKLLAFLLSVLIQAVAIVLKSKGIEITPDAVQWISLTAIAYIGLEGSVDIMRERGRIREERER